MLACTEGSKCEQNISCARQVNSNMQVMLEGRMKRRDNLLSLRKTLMSKAANVVSKAVMRRRGVSF